MLGLVDNRTVCAVAFVEGGVSQKIYRALSECVRSQRFPHSRGPLALAPGSTHTVSCLAQWVSRSQGSAASGPLKL